MIKTTLCFVMRKNDTELLMIFKKRGQGAKKYNVPGGKIESGEEAMPAAIRETQEETGITPQKLVFLGELEFIFDKNSKADSWDNHCSVFIAESYSGELQPETDECGALWVPLANIPYDKMWDDDRHWFPLALKRQKFYRRYFFDVNDRMKKEEILD